MLKPIGITGAIAAGKDTLADMLVAHESGLYTKYSLAAPMKEIAHNIFGFTKAQLTDHALKETTDEFWNITPRRFLQIMGTDMFRDVFRDDVWLKLAEKHMQNTPTQHVVIPDIRFENEAQFIKDLGGTLVHIIRPGHEAPVEACKHSSEQGIDSKYIDYTIKNDSDIASLNYRVNASWAFKLIKEED